MKVTWSEMDVTARALNSREVIGAETVEVAAEIFRNVSGDRFIMVDTDNGQMLSMPMTATELAAWLTERNWR